MIDFKQFNLIKNKILKLLIITISTVILWVFFNPLPILAQNNNPPTPQTCKVGVYLLSLDKFNFLEQTFDADFWLWSVCPTKELNPIETLEIVNAKSLDQQHNNILEKNDPFDLFPNINKVYWSQAKINVTMLNNWDLKNYPFDRHILTIPLEESIYDTSQLKYIPDLKDSGYKDNLKIFGWKITKFELVNFDSEYTTSFGDPEKQSGGSKYNQLLVKIYIERTSLLGFVKLSAGVYIAAAIAFLSFFFNPDKEIGSRVSLLVGSLFTTLVNMQVTDSVLGTTNGLSLVDKIHITTIFYIAFATLITLYSHLIYEKGFETKAIFLDRKICVPVFSISFIIFNLIIIFNAVKTG